MRSIAVALGLLVGSLAVASETEIAKLAIGPGIFSTLGHSVEMVTLPAPFYGLAIAGAPGADSMGLVGQAFVYRPNGSDWTSATSSTLMASDGASSDYFGIDVDISGLHVLVGAPGQEAVYVYLNGTSERKISSGSNTLFFGRAVAFDGSSIAVGAADAAHVFTDTSGGNWITYSEVIFHPSNPLASYYGGSIDFEGSTLVVGASISHSHNGAVYVHEGLSETEILSIDNAVDAQFGHSVSLSGSTIAIGAPADATYAGSVYIVQDISAGGDWSALRQTKLVPSDPVDWDRFGISVSVKGSTLAVGATRKDSFVNSAGGVYVFEDTSAAGDWTSYSQTILQASDAGSDDRLGMSVAFAGDKVISGAYMYDDESVSDTGAVYLFFADFVIFSDGFESQDTSRWSASMP